MGVFNNVYSRLVKFNKIAGSISILVMLLGWGVNSEYIKDAILLPKIYQKQVQMDSSTAILLYALAHVQTIVDTCIPKSPAFASLNRRIDSVDRAADLRLTTVEGVIKRWQ